MTITLPIPSRGLSPNSRLGWRNKSKITQRSRSRAYLATVAAIAGRELPPFTGYSLAFHFPDARKRDDDNAEASTKAYRDGIAAALRMDDYHLRKCALSTFAIDRTNPRLEITLHP